MKLPRIYPILDTASLERRGISAPLAAAAMLDAGSSMLQFRHKGHWGRAVFADALEVSRLCRERNALFIVDDRADMALLLEAGLHVGQDDLAPRQARALMGPRAVVGFSTHSRRQVESGADEPVTYVGFGPIFATSSKSNPDPVTGIEKLRAVRPLVKQPLVAIGGITRENARFVWAAGADAVAVIGDLIPADCGPASLTKRMEEWQQLART